MGTIKERNDKERTEIEEIKEDVVRIHRRTGEKILDDLDNHDGVVTHLAPYILRCEVKWALGSIV